MGSPASGEDCAGKAGREGMTHLEMLLDEVAKEREKQDAMWGRRFVGRSHSEWFAILGEEFGEVARAVTELNATHKRKAEMRAELMQVAAVCLSWIELGIDPS